MSKRAGLCRWLIVCSVLAFSGLAASAPARAFPHVGSLEVMVIANSGSGWAVGNSGPDSAPAISLLRIENGALRVVADSQTNPSLLPAGLEIRHMVITADGTHGWAIGDVGRDMSGYGSPMLWRLQNGSWGVAKNNFSKDLALYDLTMSSDGSDGWMVTDEQGASDYGLLRLRNGDWHPAPGPGGVYLTNVASSLGGNQTWLLGRANPGLNAYRWTGWKWVLMYSNVMPDRDPIEFAADDTGNAWLIGGSCCDNYLGEEQLIHFSDKIAPYQIALDQGLPGTYNQVFLALWSLTVSDRGGGWIIGGYQYQGEGNSSYSKPVLIHLQDSTATLVEPQSAGITLTGDSGLGKVAISPDGVYSWLDRHNGQGFGNLVRLRDPSPVTAQPDKPATAGVGYWPGLLAGSLLVAFAGIAYRKRVSAARRGI